MQKPPSLLIILLILIRFEGHKIQKPIFMAFCINVVLTITFSFDWELPIHPIQLPIHRNVLCIFPLQLPEL